GGISVGARMAMVLGLDYPERCRALILGGGGSGPHLRQEKRLEGYRGDLAEYRRFHIGQVCAPGFTETPIGRYLLEMFLETTPQLDGEAICQVFIAQGAVDLRPRLPEMT